MRVAVREGQAIGLFVEGTRQLCGEIGPVQPGAAMVAVQEDVPVVPAAIHGTQRWKPGNWAPVSIAWGEPMRFDGLPKGAKGYREGSAEIAAKLKELHSWLVEVHAHGRPRQATPRHDRETPPGRHRRHGRNRRFPNVGKSTLINRLTESRQAVVHETPGVTRDRKELLCEWNGVHFLLIDTGGIDDEATDAFGPEIAKQARTAIEEADLVLFVVDARAGITPGDEDLARTLRAAKKPVLVLANKIDDPRQDPLSAEFHRLGLGEPVPLSALHGHGTGDLLDEIVERLPGEGRPPVGDEAIRVAILGRPNVGKSSLLNALVGRERVIVSDVPGTTRDTIDTILEHDGRTFQLVDTAGLRRKRKQRQGIEYYSELRALAAAERADVVLVLVDASEGSSTRISPSPTSPARPTPRPSSCSRSGTRRRCRSRRCGRGSRRGCGSGRRSSRSRRRPVAASSACSSTSSRSTRSTPAGSRRRL